MCNAHTYTPVYIQFIKIQTLKHLYTYLSVYMYVCIFVCMYKYVTYKLC